MDYGYIATNAISLAIGGGVIKFLAWYDKRRDVEYSRKSNFDETELKKYKEAFDNIQQQFEQLQISTIPSNSPKWIRNAHGEYKYVSPSYEMTILLPLGLCREDVIDKSDEDVWGKYPDFWEMMRLIDQEAIQSEKKFAIRHDVKFPGNDNQMMVIKEISQNIMGKTFFVGRCYPEI